MKPEIVDLHQDLRLHVERRDLFPGDHWQTSFEMLKKANVKLTVASGFPVPPEENFLDPVANDLIEEDFVAYNKYCKENPDWFLVTKKIDLETLFAKQNQSGLLLHVEGLNAFSGEWDMLERWYALGWRSLGIVWNLTNSLGGGTKDFSQGLTSLGSEMLEWLQEHRMVVDFAHMNAPTFYDAVKIMKQPIVVSHGNAAALCPNPRNYTDEQLRLIAESGGVVGVFFASTYLVGKEKGIGTVVDVVNHVDYLRDIMSIDHVALGTDFGGVTTGLLSDIDAIDKIALFWSELQKRGYTENEIEKISHLNAHRVLREILPQN
jgi:membrane dipeptidase